MAKLLGKGEANQFHRSGEASFDLRRSGWLSTSSLMQEDHFDDLFKSLPGRPPVRDPRKLHPSQKFSVGGHINCGGKQPTQSHSLVNHAKPVGVPSMKQSTTGSECTS
jgi:hypothetical protein